MLLSRFSSAFAITLAALAVVAQTSVASAKRLDATRISLPKGPGSVEGLGKNFTPSLASGTASYGVDIAVPPAAGGFAPKLSLDYDSGGGISDLGIGWSLGGFAEIRRRTENGLPKFDGTDAFEIAGFGAPSDLLEIASNVFRPQYESGSFVRVQRSADGKTWEARDKSGTTFRFGGDGFVEEEGGKVATWLLREQLDVFGHSIKYTWKTDGSHGRLERVVYNDFSPEACNEVAFKYEARPDPHTRFTSGIKEEFKDRVTAVEVLHGGALVRRYDLTYKPGLHSQLATVTLVGSDGVTKLPTLSLAYAEAKLAVDAGGLVAMKTPPGRSPSDANVDLADLDGDGLPDLLVTSAGNYRSYINHDGLSWKTPVDWGTSASPSLELAQTGVQLADLDGDGALDLVAKSGTSYFRYFPGLNATSFAPPVSIKTVPNFTFEDADVRVADMDGDRRADVVITTSVGIAIGYNKNGVDWTEPATVGIVDPKQPLLFSDGKTQLCDVNGDRVQDLCYLRSGSLVYWLGRGRGKFEPARTATGVPEFDATSPWQLVDLDGDGWVDLVHVGVTNVQVALASGEGLFAEPKTISGTPTKGPSGVVKFADMNGSGTTDIVWIDVTGSPDTAWRYLELFPEGRGGLLRTIDNGLGKRVTITYGAASKDAAVARDAGKAWTTRMNTAMPVVKALELDSGLGDPLLRTEYIYRDGTFSPAERTLAGFGGGIEKAIGDEFTPTLLTDSTFDVGLSDRTLRGVLLGSEQRDEKGNIFSRSKSTWSTRALDAALDGRVVTYSFKKAERVDHIEGTDPAKARVTLTEWEQDNFGNVTAEKKWGEVAGHDKLAGNDEMIVVRTFANNTIDWLLGRVATEEIQDGKGTRVRMRRVRYDGAPFEGLPLGQVARGNISREEAWVGPALDRFELIVASRYDADGNPVETKDARDGGRAFTWDPANRTLITSESVKTGTRVLTQFASFDAAFGNLLSFTTYNGSASAYRYDALGRITTVIKPGDSDERPTFRYGYELGAPMSRVTIESRVFSGRDDVEYSVNVFDGMSRRRATFVREAGGRWTVGGVGHLDKRGNPRRALIPFFGSAEDVSNPPVSHDGSGEDVWRDALGRTVRSRTQLGIETRTVFEPFTTKHWDGAQNDSKAPYEHTPTMHQEDGLGRLVAVAKTLEGKTILQRYSYDAAGQLLSRVDAENNVARYTYDGRGRRLLVDDPDAGKHQFVYDQTGNVIEHRGPDGKSRRVAYDLAARPIAEDWNGDGAPEVFRTYDDAENGLGLLASVTDPTGGSTYSYDARQRLVRTDLRIQDALYSIGAAYDAQDRKYLHRYPDGSSIRIQYGPRGLITGYGKDAVIFAYDADGRELQRTFNTGVTEVNGYDADRRRIANKVSAPDGSLIQHLEWTFDGAGNILELRDRRGVDAGHDRSTQYTYDNLYRLRKEAGRWGATEWTYSASGNVLTRTSSDPNQGGAFAYGGSAGPHALTTYNGRALKHDARGRLLDDGARKYVWDDADHLIEVAATSGASETSVFDGDGVRRVRVERDAQGTHTTHFIDEWEEVRDGKLTRYIAHGGLRIVRLADGNGGPAQGSTSSALSSGDTKDEPPPARDLPNGQPIKVTSASEFFLAVALLAALGVRYRHALSRALPVIVPLALFWVVAGTTLSGCKGDGEDPPLPVEEGTVLSLGDADELLFGDAVGSLTETTTGSGRAKASSATFAYGTTRYDSSPESRKFANTPRDAGVGLDQMGARSYASDLSIFTSPDPLAVHDPTALIAHLASAAYTYAGANPVRNTDRTGLLETPDPQKVAESGKTAADFFAKLGIPVAGATITINATGASTAATTGVGVKAVAAVAIAAPVILVVGVAAIGAYTASGFAPQTRATLAPGSAAGGLAAAPASGTIPSTSSGPPGPPPKPPTGSGGGGNEPCYSSRDDIAAKRKAFESMKPQLWKKEAKLHRDKYTKEQLEFMDKGEAPWGSDGKKMEIHHKVPLANCGENTFENMQFMTYTEHRGPGNYKKNHPDVKKPKEK